MATKKFSAVERLLRAKLGLTTPKVKLRKTKAINAIGQVKYTGPGMGKEFYLTDAWQSLRYSVLMENAKAHGGKAQCEVCGSRNELQGDHVKPRHLFPALELVKSNVQILCRPCNAAKGASL